MKQIQDKKLWLTLIAVIVAAVVLAAVFFFSGNLPDKAVSTTIPAAVDETTVQTQEPETAEETEQTVKDAKSETQAATQAEQDVEQQTTTVTKPETTKPDKNASVAAPAAEKERQQEKMANTASNPANKTTNNSCTISISCAAVLNRTDLCDPAKLEVLPKDGWILQPVTVTFQAGDTVLDVLQQVCREQKIHMEYENTPLYESSYIEGIANLYEFDAGGESGWMYQVNDWFPNYGCSQYTLQDQDVISWVYTCDMGADVGREVSADA